MWDQFSRGSSRILANAKSVCTAEATARVGSGRRATKRVIQGTSLQFESNVPRRESAWAILEPANIPKGRISDWEDSSRRIWLFLFLLHDLISQSVSHSFPN